MEEELGFLEVDSGLDGVVSSALSSTENSVGFSSFRVDEDGLENPSGPESRRARFEGRSSDSDMMVIIKEWRKLPSVNSSSIAISFSSVYILLSHRADRVRSVDLRGAC